MTTKYVQAGKTLAWTNATGAAVSAGDVVVAGELVGIALVDIANGATGSVGFDGVYSVTKVAGVAWTQGQRIYYDTVAENFTTVVKSVFAGFASAAALLAATTGYVKLAYVPRSAVVTALGATANLTALAVTATSLTALVVAASSLTALAVTATTLTPLVVTASTVDDLATGDAYTDAAVNTIFGQVEGKLLLKSDNVDVETLRTETAAALLLKSDNVDCETLRTESAAALLLKADNVDCETLRTELLAALLLKSDNADAETLRTEVEARLDALEAKEDAVIAALKAADIMASA